MDLKVPDPIRMDQVAIKVEEIETHEHLSISESRIYIKHEASTYSDDEEDVDEHALEECDVIIQREPACQFLKDPLCIEEGDVSKESVIIKEEVISDDGCPDLSKESRSLMPAEPIEQHLKTVQVSQNLLFFVLNQQLFATKLPNALKEPSNFKLVIQPPPFKPSEAIASVSPPLRPIMIRNKPYVACSSPPPLIPFAANDKLTGINPSLQMLCSTEMNVNSQIIYMYKCFYCNGRCKDKVELLQHMLESHKDNQMTVVDTSLYPFKCFSCAGRCKTRVDLHKHMIEAHYPKNLGGIFGDGSNVQVLHPLVPNIPSTLGLTFCRKPILTFNVNNRSKRKKNNTLIQKGTTANMLRPQQDVTNYIFICYYCNGRSSNKEELEQHILLTHIPYLGRASPKSSIPTTILPATKAQRKPRKRRERAIYQCNYCSYQALRPCMIRDHIAAKHTFEKPYKCQLCDYRSSSKGLVLGHIKSKHSIKPFKCDQCDFRASQLCKVKYHAEAKHSKLKKYKCPHCDYRAVHAAGIRGHVAFQHEKTRTFHCPYCGFITRHANGLQIHVISKHTKDRPFRCQECDYGAVTARNLKYHIMTKHTHERPYPCHQCSYKAVSANSLKKHIESKHLELKQFCCDYCDYKSSRPLVLKKHIQSKHLGEKPYQCYHCGYASVWLGNLKLHVRTKHNKDKWYKCSYCYFRTFIAKNLKQHKAKHFCQGKLVVQPKRGRGRPPGSGKSRKLQINLEESS